MSWPAVTFGHLYTLSDDTGLLEHARGAVPRRQHGYCVDDVARGLVALAREPEPDRRQIELAARYLAFVAHAQQADGTCRNRLGYDRRWVDDPGLGDWWGRALWGLGATVSGRGPAWLRSEALDRFSRSCQVRSPWPRALAFAALGAAEVVAAVPDHAPARSLLRDALSLGRPVEGDESWLWPEARLTYANAAWAEALVAAGSVLGDDLALRDGLRLLTWLVDLQTADDHLSVTPAGGWAPGEPRPGFDQQPIEIAALADGCARAFAVTGEPRWQIGVGRCVGWWLGANDVGVTMHDPATGGGYDGLEAGGPNRNQGAESTLAWLMTQQHGRRMAGG